MSFGGPPPGGFGGPPPEGPPGGAFGGPPPGGFGGPPPDGPPGGAFGGPPPGGAFGGPPPGSPLGGPFGPPGGGPFGPPGGGAFAQAVPKKSGSNVGLIVGLGCGALALLSVIGAAVGFYMVRRAATDAASSYESPPLPTARDLPAAPAKPAAPTGDLKAELKDLTAIKSRYGKSMRFVGEIHNTGSVDLGYPAAKVTFYDAAGTALETGSCGSLMRVLPPGEKAPCMMSIFKGLDYTSHKAEITPFRSSFRGQIADIAISDTKLTPRRGYQPDTVEGKLTNKSAFKAKNVWAIVTLYDTSDKIVGADNALVAGSDLEPGQSGLFSARVYETASSPAKFRVLAIGYSE